MSKVRWGLVLSLCMAAAARGQGPFMADTTRTPRVMVMWETVEGKTVKLEGEREYRSAADKAMLGKNIECFVAMGGTRLDKGLGDPNGAIVRVGLSKKDVKELFFADIAEGGRVTITLDHVWLTRPVEVRPRTGLMYERYVLGDLEACGLDGNARNLIVTVDAEDPIKGKVQEGSLRAGGLDGVGPEHGKVEAKVEADGSVTMTVTFPYPLLRHVKDPFLRTKPGAFFEPQQIHVEMEVVEAGKSGKAAEEQK